MKMIWKQDHNNEEYNVYRAAMILYSMSRSGEEVGSPMPTSRFTRSQRRVGFISPPHNNVVDEEAPPQLVVPPLPLDDDVDEEQSSADEVNEVIPPVPPPDPPNNNIDDEVEEAGGPPAIPPVPQIVNIIGACSPPFQKQLTKSDVTDGQGRLTLRKVFVRHHLVPMFNENEDLKVGIEVTTYDGEGRPFDMTFKLWASKLYVLMKGWKAFYKMNNLTEEGEHVTVWMFRHVQNGRLCFAITRGRRIEEA